jgi:hypothetical protein
MTTNKNDANDAAVHAALGAVRSALEKEPTSAAVTSALEQCGRLELALGQFHSEGLRFAAFTLLRTISRAGPALGEPVHSATLQLKTALESAGYPH